MGLDMYLSKKHYVKNWDHQPKEEHVKVTVKQNGKKYPYIDANNITYIQEGVGYWRKANQIHQWFVDNCQNGVDECQEAWVDPEQLRELLQTCIAIRDNCPLVKGKVENGYSFGKDGEKIINWIDGEVMENQEFAAELLPTQEGFFFGGTGYDQWYMEDILNTIKILEKELAIDYGRHQPEYYYRSSW